jgi:hypothetical protein
LLLSGPALFRLLNINQVDHSKQIATGKKALQVNQMIIDDAKADLTWKEALFWRWKSSSALEEDE